MIGVYVAVVQDVDELDLRISDILGSAFSSNTLALSNSQWKLFLQFCKDRALVSIPVEFSKVTCVFWLTTINNYLSAVITLQKCDFRSTFLIQLIMSGLKSRLGNCSTPKRPFSVVQLYNIFHCTHVLI